MVKRKSRGYGARELPWLTENDIAQMKKEVMFLEKRKSNNSDVSWFKLQVLDRYRKHKFCALETGNKFNCILAFLDYNRKDIVASLEFSINNNSILMMRSTEFVKIPPKERRHWQKYEVEGDLRSGT